MPTKIFFNGKIATNGKPYFVQALAVESGKISAYLSGWRLAFFTRRSARGETSAQGLNSNMAPKYATFRENLDGAAQNRVLRVKPYVAGIPTVRETASM